jgi:hypothetical protein
MRKIPIPPVSQELLEKIAEGLPEYFARSDIGELTHGIFTVGNIENLCYQGKGPETHYVGNKCVITKEAFISWLKRRYSQGVVYGTSNTQADGNMPEGPASPAKAAGRKDRSPEDDRERPV